MACKNCNKDKELMGNGLCKECRDKEFDAFYGLDEGTIIPTDPNAFAESLITGNATYKIEGTMIGEESVIFFGKHNRVAFTIVDGKLDIEVTGEITEAAKMFLDKVKGMMIK
jgi:hypothetical protein